MSAMSIYGYAKIMGALKRVELKPENGRLAELDWEAAILFTREQFNTPVSGAVLLMIPGGQHGN